MFRRRGEQLEVLLAHPGGPLYRNKDDGVWTIPKGEIDSGEDLLRRARIEFEEEVGTPADGDDWIVTGQKTWTTLANDANWIFLLVRTDRTAKKQAGISFLLVPMDSPGITVRPIVNLDLHDEFLELVAVGNLDRASERLRECLLSSSSV